MVALIIGHVLLLRRSNYEKLTSEDIYLMNVVMFRIPTNWVVVLKWHIIDVGINDWCELSYGVFIRMDFSDEQDSTKIQDELPDSDSEQKLPSPMSEYKRFVANRCEKVSKRASLMNKSLMDMNKKMDEIIKNYVENSTSIEESTYEDNESSEEDFME
ncbi:hypothetical protein V8G54_007841 [Vigna mungo]|uniref:Uncharacterized protein n=1 Tax=Vigna mungo TaxID=3915 RepID=A0AAQ3P2F2_VIGMU